jgi:hypothetical protein
LKNIRFLASMAVLAAVVASSQALLVNPSGGTLLWDGTTSDHDDDTTTVTPGGTFNLFGTAFTSLSVCNNGNLNTLGSNAWTNSAFPLTEGGMRIAPSWDDMYVYNANGANDYVSHKSGAGYWSVTWSVSHIQSQTNHSVFQAILFNANTTLGGFNFLANDIAFSYDSYGTIGTGDPNATIGVNSGTGSFAVIPGTTDGLITSSNANLVPIYPTTGQFILFRWGGNNYTGSIQSAVPEPASMAALGIGALALIRRRRAR